MIIIRKGIQKYFKRNLYLLNINTNNLSFPNYCCCQHILKICYERNVESIFGIMFIRQYARSNLHVIHLKVFIAYRGNR